MTNILGYDDIQERQSDTIANYGYEEIDLLLADVSDEDREVLEETVEILDTYSYDTIFIPIDEVEDYVKDTLADYPDLVEVIEKAELEVYPYQFLQFEFDAFTDHISINSVEVVFDSETYYAIEV